MIAGCNAVTLREYESTAQLREILAEFFQDK
jgi:hypothetical protein